MQAYAKYRKDFAGGPPSCPTITVPDPASIRIPPLPPPSNTPRAGAGGSSGAESDPSGPALITPHRGGGGRAEAEGGASEDPLLLQRLEQLRRLQLDAKEGPRPLFVWEQLDPRFDPTTCTWRQEQPEEVG